MADRHVLIALDESQASRRALLTVADEVRAGSVDRVTLLHVLPPTPPRFLEHGGGEDPGVEAERDARLRERRRAWEAQQAEAARPALADARDRLVRAGLGADRIALAFRSGEHYRDVARHALEEARRRGCSRVVVGRSTYPWYVELLKTHASEALVEEGPSSGVDVRVVE